MKLLLIDGTNLVMRCVSAQQGYPAKHILGTAERMVRRAADTVRATHLVVAFDAPGHSFRKTLYPEYKAHRAERAMDTERWAMEACAAFEQAGLYCVFVPEFEADDVIATLATRATANAAAGVTGHLVDVHILSGDSDLLVLAEHPQVHCWQFEPKAERGIIERSREWICQKYGIATPAQLTDYKVLVGESGDGVPGVAGVGPVRARRLLKEYGTLDNLAAHGMLGASALWAAKARELIALRTDAPIPQVKPSNCRLQRRSAAA